MRGFRRPRALLAWIVSTGTLVAAQPGSSETASGPVSESVASTPELLRLVAVTGIIVGLIYLTFYALKRLSNGTRRGLLGQSSSMEVLESLPLGARRFLLVVRVGKRHVLLGATDQAVHHLCDLDDWEGGALEPSREGFQAFVGRHARVLEESETRAARHVEPSRVGREPKPERAAQSLL